MATLIPAAGSAYTYTYSVLGETLAWIVGWSLILEYSLACSTVAVGWSAYLVGWIESLGIDLPDMLLAGPQGGGIINLPAVLVALAVAGLLIAGTRESATLNIVLVIIKMTALTAFVVIALPFFDADRLEPFMPHGFASHVEGGATRGVMAAAAIVFFAFYGFDAVATSAEEAKNHQPSAALPPIGDRALGHGHAVGGQCSQYDHTDRLTGIERALTEIALGCRRNLDLEMLVIASARRFPKFQVS